MAMVPVSTTEIIRLAVKLLLLSFREYRSPASLATGFPQESYTSFKRREPVNADRLIPKKAGGNYLNPIAIFQWRQMRAYGLCFLSALSQERNQARRVRKTRSQKDRD
jgi:hypothetical protein